MRILNSILAAALALAAACGARAGEGVKFEQIVPADAWLVLGVDDIAAARERWHGTALGAWWRSDEVQAVVKEELEALRKRVRDRRQELGVDEDAWSWPSSFGFAGYLVHDQELDADLPHFILCAQWSADADRINGIVEAVLAEMQKKDAGAVSSVDIHGKPGKAIRVPGEPRDVKKKPRRGQRSGGSIVPDGAFDHIDTLYFVRDGDRFLLGSVKQDLDEAIGVFEGSPRSCVADAADFKRTLDSVGRGDGWIVLLTAALHKVAGAGGPQLAMVQPFMQILFGDVHGFGFSLTSDAPGAQFELATSIVVDGERSGLLAVPNPARSPSPPPPFADPDAGGYGVANIQFPQIMKVIESVVAALPEDVAQPFDASLQQYGPDLSRAFARLGPDVHIVRREFHQVDMQLGLAKQTLTAVRKEESLYAIRCADEPAVTGLLNLFLPQAGFETRDFDGNTVFDDKSRESCWGFGGGWFFVGSTAMVEQSLRSLRGTGAAGSLADTANCRQALADLGVKPVLCWGYQDVLMRMETTRREAAKPMGTVSVGVSTSDQDIESRMARQLGLEMPSGVIYALLTADSKLWKNAMGPAVFFMTAESTGLLTRVRLLPPAAP
jgi:hypothetical protein